MAYVTELASGNTILDVADKEILNLRVAANANKVVGVNSDGTAYEVKSVVNGEQGAANAGKVIQVNASGNAVASDSDMNLSEKVYTGTASAINLANGPIQFCSASSITLPAVKSGYTLTLICSAAAITTWGGSIKWQDGQYPIFSTPGENIVTFIGAGSYWYGCFNGTYEVV